MTLRNRSLMQAAAVCLVLTAGSLALISLPFQNVAEAQNGGGKGGSKGGGKGGGAGGGNSGNNGKGTGNADGAKGNGTGSKGNSAANGGNAAKGNSAASGKDPDDADDEGGVHASNLGKLNGALHASPNAVANASPNSVPGGLGVFRDLLNGYVDDANTPPEEGAPPAEIDMDALAEALAGITNKPTTPATIDTVVDHLAAMTGEDYSSITEDEEGEPSEFSDDLSTRVNELNGFADEAADDETESADAGDVTE